MQCRQALSWAGARKHLCAPNKQGRPQRVRNLTVSHNTLACLGSSFPQRKRERTRRFIGETNHPPTCPPAASRRIMGSMKDRVLPDPVGAQARTSRPPTKHGTACICWSEPQESSDNNACLSENPHAPESILCPHEHPAPGLTTALIPHIRTSHLDDSHPAPMHTSPHIRTSHLDDSHPAPMYTAHTCTGGVPRTCTAVGSENSSPSILASTTSLRTSLGNAISAKAAAGGATSDPDTEMPTWCLEPQEG